MIQGPIRITRFSPSSQQAPEPDLTANPEFILGQILCCPQTGRLWLVGAANGTNTKQVRQVLPWVRSTDGATSMRMTNNNGSMKIAGNGSISLCDAVFIDGNGLTYASGLLFGDSTGFVSGVTAQDLKLWEQDESLGTDPANPTSLQISIQQAYGRSYFQMNAPSVVWFNLTLQFYHNNNYQVTAALEYFNHQNGNSKPIQVVTGNSQGGYMQLNMTAVGNFDVNFPDISLRAYADTSGVVHRPVQAANSWPTQPSNASFQYKSRFTYLRMI